MNIKIKQLKIDKLLFCLILILGCLSFLVSFNPEPLQAQASKVCADKGSGADCEKKVEEKCKDKKGKDKTKCEKETAEKYPKALALGGSEGKYQCGKGADTVKTRFNFGCVGNNSKRSIGPIEDLVYALVRTLSYGVGLAIVISLIVSGIQYSTSEGNAETTQASKNRIQSAVVGLVIYIFAFSLVQYLVPGGLFTS